MTKPVSNTAWGMIALAVGLVLVIFGAIFVGQARGETVRWQDAKPKDPQPWWDVGEVSWPGHHERFRIQSCSSYPCLRTVVTIADIPPAVEVRVRTRSDLGWSGYSNSYEYWECKDVAGADGVVGMRDFVGALRLGGLEGFAAWRRYFTQTCSDS